MHHVALLSMSKGKGKWKCNRYVVVKQTLHLGVSHCYWKEIVLKIQSLKQFASGNQDKLRRMHKNAIFYTGHRTGSSHSRENIY